MAVIAGRLDRVVVVAGDLDRLTRFHVGLGFVADDARDGPDHAALADAARASTRLLRLGAQVLELVAFDPPGAPYPLPARSTDPWFQHVALVAPDIDAAMARLRALDGWTAISRDGVVTLPPEAGGVSAFKFRDPDGHPLEFLAFPPGHAPEHWRGGGPGLLGYDHSAIGVTDVAASVAFYHDGFGMALGRRTLNRGPAQSALDDVDGAVVDVVAMRPARATPHLELLGYHVARAAPAASIGPRDVAATRLVLAVNDLPEPYVARDPDGHWLQVSASRDD